MSNCIGILGGSFNPVHKGHVFLADYVRKNCELDRVFMIPTGHHPFKSKRVSVDGEHRLEMLRLATEGMEGLEVSDIEVKSPELSYTYVTLCKLREELENRYKLNFIIGTDELLSLERWYEIEALMKEFGFIVGIRPSYELDKVNSKIQWLRREIGDNIRIINLPAPDVSSSMVREAIEAGKDLSGLVPDKVNLYIKRNGLYAGRQE